MSADKEFADMKENLQQGSKVTVQTVAQALTFWSQQGGKTVDLIYKSLPKDSVLREAIAQVAANHANDPDTDLGMDMGNGTDYLSRMLKDPAYVNDSGAFDAAGDLSKWMTSLPGGGPLIMRSAKDRQAAEDKDNAKWQQQIAAENQAAREGGKAYFDAHPDVWQRFTEEVKYWVWNGNIEDNSGANDLGFSTTKDLVLFLQQIQPGYVSTLQASADPHDHDKSQKLLDILQRTLVGQRAVESVFKDQQHKDMMMQDANKYL
jgi:hypothetical protein